MSPGAEGDQERRTSWAVYARSTDPTDPMCRRGLLASESKS